MPVIINDLEIVSEPETREEGTPAEAQFAPPKPQRLPQEVEAILDMQCARCIRVRAD